MENYSHKRGQVWYTCNIRTYLKYQCDPLNMLILLCQVTSLTILSHQIQKPSTDLHYPAKYFWHLTKISNIKEQYIIAIQFTVAQDIKLTFAFGCLTLALNHSG